MDIQDISNFFLLLNNDALGILVCIFLCTRIRVHPRDAPSSGAAGSQKHLFKFKWERKRKLYNIFGFLQEDWFFIRIWGHFVSSEDEFFTSFHYFSPKFENWETI